VRSARGEETHYQSLMVHMRQYADAIANSHLKDTCTAILATLQSNDSGALLDSLDTQQQDLRGSTASVLASGHQAAGGSDGFVGRITGDEKATSATAADEQLQLARNQVQASDPTRSMTMKQTDAIRKAQTSAGEVALLQKMAVT
jgi:hypothetical protein